MIPCVAVYLLFVFLVVGTVIMVIVTIRDWPEDGAFIKFSAAGTLSCLLVAVCVWLAQSLAMPARVTEEVVLTPTVMAVPDGKIEVVAYRGGDNDITLVNLTALFHRSGIKKVKLIRYAPDGYLGITYWFIAPKLEIVDETQ